MILTKEYKSIVEELNIQKVQLIAVSKTKPVSDLVELYEAGQRAFGENYVQELVEKQPQLPNDIQWHFIGHLQSNKVKYIAPFVHTIHSVDSLKLLLEIEKQAQKFQRKINCLLQVYIASEETKFGLDENELNEIFEYLKVNPVKNVTIIGMMGMASNTTDSAKVRNEFQNLKLILNKIKKQFNLENNFKELSIGMSGDYKIAVEEGSTMVRIGSLIFGERNYSK